jgi:hypothetical protein
VLAYASSPASAADGACTPTDLVIGTANPACVSADKVVADAAALLGAQRTATNLKNQMNLLGTLAKSFQGTAVEQAAQA